MDWGGLVSGEHVPVYTLRLCPRNHYKGVQ